jgi:CopG family nickel-responsive transcriptional regulator
MERVTISLEDALLAKFDEYIAEKGYTNRSEAVRDVLRAFLDNERIARTPDTPCIACVTYVYDHMERNLASRLTRTQHDHHDLGLSTLHVHIDHDTCMEAAILRGAAAEVRHFADGILAQPGVRHGHIHLVAIEDHGRHGHKHG